MSKQPKYNPLEQFNPAILKQLRARRRASHNTEPPKAVRAESDQKGNLELFIYDVIGEDFFFGGVSALEVAEVLSDNADADTVTVRINSPGGDVFDGVAIYNALRAHPGQVITQIDGLAASAASVIAMAGDSIRIAEQAQMMLHRAWTIALGDVHDMQKTAELLESIDEGAIALYSHRSGTSKKQIRGLVDAETWLTADQAVERGLADQIIDHDQDTNPSGAKQRKRPTPKGLERVAALSAAAMFKDLAMTKNASRTKDENNTAAADEQTDETSAADETQTENHDAGQENENANPAETTAAGGGADRQTDSETETGETETETSETPATLEQLTQLAGQDQAFVVQALREKLTFEQAALNIVQKRDATIAAAKQETNAEVGHGLAGEKPKHEGPLGEKLGAFADALTIKGAN